MRQNIPEMKKIMLVLITLIFVIVCTREEKTPLPDAIVTAEVIKNEMPFQRIFLCRNGCIDGHCA